MSKMFFNMLAVFAGFEAGLLKMRTREGMAHRRSRGSLKGTSPSSPRASRPRPGTRAAPFQGPGYAAKGPRAESGC